MLALELTVKGKEPDYEAATARFIRTAAQKIRMRMREKMHEPKSGRLYARKRGDGFRRSHRASAQGEAPASDTGAMERSLTIIRKSSLESLITTNLDYPVYLEDPDKLDRPLWLATVDEMLPMLENDLMQMLS